MSAYAAILVLQFFVFKKVLLPWLVWFSGSSAGLRTKWSLVLFLVRAHAWVAAASPGCGCSGGNRPPLFLPPFPSLKINKVFLKK